MPDEEVIVADTRTNEDLDKLVDSNEVASNRSGPTMTEEAPKASSVPSDDGFEFTHNGKAIKATREQLLKWAQQGYDYPQRAQKLNQEKAKWDQEKQSWEKQWGHYKQIDEFAQKNKDWWNHVVQGWNSRGGQQVPIPGAPQGQQTIPNGQGSLQGQNGAGTPQYDQWGQKFQTLEQKLSQIEPFIAEFQQERLQSKERAADETLEKEIKSIREKHSDLDWDSLDDNGKKLELRILEHAQATGIPTFRAAMRDMLHDELVMKAQSQGKLAVTKGIQTRSKLGVLGESPTPIGRMTPRAPQNIRKTSYEQLQQEALEELRSGGSR